MAAGDERQRRWRFDLATLFIVAVVAFFIGLSISGAVRTDAELLGNTAFDSCVGASCVKTDLRAHYRYLECSYGRLWSPGVRVAYLVQGWEGDLDIPAEMTESGKPFPPPLPPLRRLSAEEIERVKQGEPADICPLFYPARDEPERDEAGLPVSPDDTAERR